MNERIKELASQCWDQRLHGRHFDQEMFAMLIVRECAKSANYWYQSHDKIHSDPMSYILAHFGVEE